MPNIALGIDLAMYYMLDDDLGLGFAIAPAFFAGGTTPTPGINFALSPRVAWRPGPVSFTFEAGFVLSAYGDLCELSNESRPPGCEPVRPAVPAGFGFGTAASALVPIWRDGDELTLEAGPVVRFQYARYDYETGDDGFGLPVFQGALAVRMFLNAHE